MKKISSLIFILCFLCKISAQENLITYIASHTLVKDANTMEVIEDFGFGSQSSLSFFSLKGRNYAVVDIMGINHYTIQIVHKETIKHDGDPYIVSELQQGGVLDDNQQLVGTIRIIAHYDISKNKVLPISFITFVDGSKVLFEYTGIVQKKN